MKFYSETDITYLFEELDKDKEWLLESKHDKNLKRFILAHITYLENALKNIIIVKE